LSKQLDNGLTVIAQRVPGSSFVGTAVAVKHGSRYEDAETNGGAHFLEHMLFKGTKKRTYKDINDGFKDIGGVYNAYTSMEETVFHVETLKEHADDGLDILADMTQNSTIDGKEFKTEKKVILEEVSMYLDDDPGLMYDTLIKKMYGGQSLARPVAGTLTSVSGLTRDDVKKIYDEKYTPQNMVVAMAGDFDPNEMYSKIENAFKDFKKGSGKKPSAHRKFGNVARTKGPNGETYFVKKPDSTQCQVIIGYKTKGDLHEDSPKLTVLNEILSARLFDEVREKRGMAYGAGVTEWTGSNYGFIGGYAATRPENVSTVKDVMLEEFEKAKENITLEELKRAKAVAKFAAAKKNESPMEIAQQLAVYKTVLGDETLARTQFDRINSVTLSDVKAAAKTYFKPDKYCMVVVGPSCNVKSYTPVKVK